MSGSYIGRQPQYGFFEKQRITNANGSTTAFDLSFTTADSAQLLVSVAGVIQEPGQAYTVLSGSPQQISFTEAPATGVDIFIIWMGKELSGPRFSSAMLTDQSALGAVPASDDYFLIYDTNASSLKKVTYANVSSHASGDVSGPGSATNNALARFDATTGKLIQNSNAILTDAGALTLTTDITAVAATFTGAFTSLGIDDNANAIAITILSTEITGFGTTTPLGTRAHIFGSGTQHVASGSDGVRELIVEGPNIPLTNSMGNIAVVANDAQAANMGGQIGFYGKTTDSSNSIQAHGIIKGAKENSTSANIASYMAFSTRANGGGNTEKLRIASAGQIGIGGANYGTSGQVLTSAGTGAAPSWADTVGGAAWVIKTGAYTAVTGDGVMVDTDSAAITITLPASGTLGDFVRIMDATGNAATNNITVGRAGHKIQGAAADLTIATARAAIGLVYVNATEGWVLIEN